MKVGALRGRAYVVALDAPLASSGINSVCGAGEDELNRGIKERRLLGEGGTFDFVSIGMEN